jgi:hypothetical protein
MTQVAIFEALSHPPLGTLVRELLPALYTGSGDLTRPAPLPIPPFNNVNAFGLTWDFFTVPAGYGRDVQTPAVFDRPMMRLSTVHTGLDGHDIISEWHDFFSDGVYWLWTHAGPTRIHYDISPGVSVSFFWLIL